MIDMSERFAHYQARLKDAMKARGMSNEELGELVDAHYVTISKLRTGKLRIDEEWRSRIAAALDVPVEELFGNAPIIQTRASVTKAARGRGRRHAADMIFDASGRRMLEIYGLAAGSAAGQTLISQDPIAEVAAPPALASVVGAYVLMTKGDSMVPRYFPNDYLYINPHQAIRPGDHVVIQTRTPDGASIQTWVKRYDGEKNGKLVAWQYNPAGKIEFKRELVEHVHRILPVNEFMLG
jgi:transcriptional regulator with XRE-family HTH domain